MEESQILAPFLAMMLLTMVVWVVMYVKRIGYIKANRINPQKLATPDNVASILPESVQLPAYNLRNLLELPVLFYALCLYLFVTGSVDGIYVVAAWIFVAVRALHSIIHCSANIVMQRFLVYFTSSIVLWLMLLRAAVQFVVNGG